VILIPQYLPGVGLVLLQDPGQSAAKPKVAFLSFFLAQKKRRPSTEAHCERANVRGPGCAVVVELAGAGEDDDANIGVAEHADLAGLLDNPGPALGEGDLPIGSVLDPLDLDLAAPHRCFSSSLSPSR
jgi:hypothetical protein